MFLLKGPYPKFETTSILPSPKFGDHESMKATIKTLRTMDGSLYTYVKRKEGLKKIRWRFQTSKNKAKEVREFIDAYYSDPIQIIDQDGTVWVGYLKNNPYEFEDVSRAPSFPGGEMTSFTLELEEK